MNPRNSIIVAALSGGLAVALGAFGAHALKPMLLESGKLETFELAVRYQFYHTLAILLTGIAQAWYNSGYLRKASVSFLFGIILFSGSLFALCLTGNKSFALVTPAGGVLFIGGWLLLAVGVMKSK